MVQLESVPVKVEEELLDLAAVAYRVLEASARLVELALEVDLELEVNCWLSCLFFADPSAHLIPRGR